MQHYDGDPKSNLELPSNWLKKWGIATKAILQCLCPKAKLSELIADCGAGSNTSTWLGGGRHCCSVVLEFLCQLVYGIFLVKSETSTCSCYSMLFYSFVILTTHKYASLAIILCHFIKMVCSKWISIESNDYDIAVMNAVPQSRGKLSLYLWHYLKILDSSLSSVIRSGSVWTVSFCFYTEHRSGY